ncbi:MAG: hypothetical protein H7308_09690 [Chthonomonadaceae bacterium]|nr:hypothetical protein [Chthonomonadaceae bacterium]
MSFIDGLIPIVAISLTMGIPMMAIWTSHQRKMLELKLKLQDGNSLSSQKTIEALREEVRSLRDTTTQYDVSFDTALQRMEGRMGAIERKVNQQGSAVQDTQSQSLGR